MNIHDSPEIRTCRLMRRGNEASEYGPRIGGRSPLGVKANTQCTNAFYLLTLPTANDEYSEFSIFLSGDKFNDFANVPAYQLVSDESIISVTLHKKSQRSTGSVYDSSLSEHPMIISEIVPDINSEDGIVVNPISVHKIGGYPFFIRSIDTLESEVANIYQQGYRLMLQMDFIVKEDADWSGSWPFGDGLFTLFAKFPYQSEDWCWLWQY
jgi:hypothetical protein